ncbi:MAG: Trp family transcriptional regulator [Spirochaetes bacterium]|jgi:TrpR family trp operon transcriptional repressor|nr:Trp family transcriptional regulator [Spirochaetota bacterium]
MPDIDEISSVLARCNNRDEMKQLLEELFTPSELSNLELRWKLLQKLARGDSQRTISADLGISLCKITRGSKLIQDASSQVYKILCSER